MEDMAEAAAAGTDIPLPTETDIPAAMVTPSEAAPLLSPLPPLPPAAPAAPRIPPTYFYTAPAVPAATSSDDNDSSSSSASSLRMVGITNDGSDANSRLLIQCKTLFSQQLPKMPREYIIRLAFDRSHLTICCLDTTAAGAAEDDDDNALMGAISVKPFAQSRFFEIAFLAVNGAHQVRGVGSLLMNHLKEYAKQRHFTHFLTYADNFAVGYFKKQGFSTQLSLPRERWYGLIKDYDGGTLMECRVHSDMDNLRVKQLVRAMQHRYVDEVLKRARLCSSSSYSAAELPSRITDAYEQLPGLRQAGWEKPSLESSTLSNAARVLLLQQLHGDELTKVLRMLLRKVTLTREASWPFLDPVPVDVVQDYLQIIRQPMDLGLIGRKIDEGAYTSASSMRSDLQLVCDNCTTYNHPDTTYYKAALAMQTVLAKLFGDLPFEKQQVLADKPAATVEVAAAAPGEEAAARDEPTAAMLV